MCRDRRINVIENFKDLVYLIDDRDCQGALEILKAVFQEADALAGNPSEATRLRVLVNRSGEEKP